MLELMLFDKNSKTNFLLYGRLGTRHSESSQNTKYNPLHIYGD